MPIRLAQQVGDRHRAQIPGLGDVGDQRVLVGVLGEELSPTLLVHPFGADLGRDDAGDPVCLVVGDGVGGHQVGDPENPAPEVG